MTFFVEFLEREPFYTHDNVFTPKVSIWKKKEPILCNTRYAAGHPPAPYTTSILSFDQQRGHILQILQIVDSDFDVFVYLLGWV